MILPPDSLGADGSDLDLVFRDITVCETRTISTPRNRVIRPQLKAS